MKNNYSKYLLISILCLIVTSCDNSKSSDKKNVDFGEVHPGKTVYKDVFVTFSPDAKKDNQTFIKLQYLVDGNAPVGVKYSYNGKTSSNNIITLYAKDFNGVESKKIGIQFPYGASVQELNGDLYLIATSKDLVGTAFGKPVKTNDVITTWHVNKTDPLPLWMTLSIWLGSIIVLIGIIYFILSRNNMPFGPKTFKNGMITFPNADASVSLVRLDNLKKYDLSAAYSDLTPGELILEPYDKLHNRKKMRFARLSNKSQSVDIKLVYDGKEEFASAAQELYNSDEIIITNADQKHTIQYSNNIINRIY
jgi:hypothetical protein